MKTFIVLSAFVLAVVLADTTKSSWNRVHKACQAKPGVFVDDAIFEKLKRNEKVTLPANFGVHAHCMLEGFGIQNSQGAIQQNGIKKAVQESVSDPAKANQIVSACSVSKSSKEETALGIFNCFGKNSVDIGQF
uniref:Pheromone binding protein 9 n=1 Tax=Cyrtotrachelus buqueti TaxID=1892066 RepID=A0A1L3KPQ2_9CUCU|nr:pheromone binding protein 9 [Cyrtotrachelus buqueti]